MPKRLEQIPIALDQLVNTVFGGWADETISSRAWRKRGDGRGWALLRKVIDAIFSGRKTIARAPICPRRTACSVRRRCGEAFRETCAFGVRRMQAAGWLRKGGEE